jgi:hypothetical protein
MKKSASEITSHKKGFAKFFADIFYNQNNVQVFGDPKICTDLVEYLLS